MVLGAQANAATRGSPGATPAGRSWRGSRLDAADLIRSSALRLRTFRRHRLRRTFRQPAARRYIGGIVSRACFRICGRIDVRSDWTCRSGRTQPQLIRRILSWSQLGDEGSFPDFPARCGAHPNGQEVYLTWAIPVGLEMATWSRSDHWLPLPCGESCEASCIDTLWTRGPVNGPGNVRLVADTSRAI